MRAPDQMRAHELSKLALHLAMETSPQGVAGFAVDWTGDAERCRVSVTLTDGRTASYTILREKEELAPTGDDLP